MTRFRSILTALAGIAALVLPAAATAAPGCCCPWCR
jgi:hypothetical protein